uniref:Fibronectin type-III domain-containing protein n=1 Tax=Macrostomum lignano TaxID=282301 RepID=A0A1I8ILG0_9PLAT
MLTGQCKSWTLMPQWECRLAQGRSVPAWSPYREEAASSSVSPVPSTLNNRIPNCIRSTMMEKKSANKQNNEDGVKIDKINPKKFRCIFNRCGIYRFAIMTESGSTGGGLACVIVLWRPELTPKPQLDWSAGKPQFRCSRAEDAGEPVDVYFTTDGSCPWPHRESVRTNQWLWFNSIATIRLVEVADGTIEVFWRKSAVPVSHSVYHLLVNGARWASGEPSNCCYRLGGLAAGREYTIQVVAAIADSATNSTQTGCYPDLLSNELRYNCPSWSTERGPLISMELLADAEDSAAVVWAALPLSRTSALIGYKVSLNGLQCGRLVTPEADGQRCRVVIEGCELNRKHSLMVNAVWTDQTGETFELPSNRLQFRLPLPKPLTAASEVDAAAAAATSESLLLFEGVCEHQQVLAAAQAEAAADKIAAEERESRSKQQEQEKQNQEEDRSKQNGEKLAKKTDEQNKSEAKNKKEKPKQKNQQKQKKENEDKKTEAKEVAKTEEGRSNNGKERKVSVAGRRFRQEGGGGGGEAAGSGGEAESQGAARRSWSCGPAARELVCGGLETGCDYISLGERISRSAPVAFKAGSTASVPLTSAGNDVDASQKASSSKQKVQMLQKEQQQPPPIPQPRLFAVSSGPNRVAVRWAFDESAATSGVELAGYQLLINGARRGGLLPSQTSQTTLEPLRPGRTIRVAVQAAAFVSSSSGEDGRVGENEDDDFRLGPASATLRVACPRRPSAPEPSVSPAPASAGVAGGAAATVSWAGAPDDAGVSRYRVYVDGQWHGDLKASPSRGNYFYYLSDLQPGLACEVQVKAIAGSDEVDPQSDTVTCLCESELSQPPLRVTGASVTQSPELKLEALDSDGLTVAWDPLTPESGI